MEENRKLREVLTFGALFTENKELKEKVQIFNAKIQALECENLLEKKLLGQYRQMLDSSFHNTLSKSSAVLQLSEAVLSPARATLSHSQSVTPAATRVRSSACAKLGYLVAAEAA